MSHIFKLIISEKASRNTTYWRTDPKCLCPEFLEYTLLKFSFLWFVLLRVLCRIYLQFLWGKGAERQRSRDRKGKVSDKKKANK